MAGSVGVAGITFGAITGIVTLSKKSTVNANCSDDARVCNQTGIDARESGRTFGTLSAVGFGVGVAGLAAGAYLWLTAPSATGAHSSLPARSAKTAEQPPKYLHMLTATPAFDPQSGTGFVAVSGGF